MPNPAGGFDGRSSARRWSLQQFALHAEAQRGSHVADDLGDVINQKAQQPASMSNDMGSVTQRPVNELIAAERFRAAKAAAARGGLGLTVVLTQTQGPG